MELSLQKIHPLSTRANTRGPSGPKKDNTYNGLMDNGTEMDSYPIFLLAFVITL